MIQASKFGQMEEAAEAIELTEEEKAMEAKLRVRYWCWYIISVLAVHVQDGFQVGLPCCHVRTFYALLMSPF